MGSFEDRVALSKDAIEKFDSILEELEPDCYHKAGREHNLPEDFNETLGLLGDITSIFLRYIPDYYVLLNKTYLIEVKGGDSISRKAYGNYMLLNDAKLNIWIVYYYDKKLMAVQPSNLILRRLERKDGYNQMPILENTWKSPNTTDKYWTEYDKREWLKKHKEVSVDDFGKIDFSNTNWYIINSIFDLKKCGE